MTQGILVSTSRLRHNCKAAILIRRGTGKTGICDCQGNMSLIYVDGKGLRIEYKYVVCSSLFKLITITKPFNINTLNTRFNLYSDLR